MQRTLSPLLEEHQLIRRVASALEWLSLRFGSSSLVDEDFLASLNVLLDYIISCHHSKEEAILFPRLTALGGDLADLVKRALEDHSAFASLAQRLGDSIREGNLSGASEAARALSSLLKDHIGWEEAVLFAQAEVVLNERVKEEIAERLTTFGGPSCSLNKAEAEVESLYSSITGG
ncbi:MAG: hemerythrin domain-containing protein [Acidilobus sp.]|nr:hemerythrin domain-containing protein [Acidilobus sp.]